MKLHACIAVLLALVMSPAFAGSSCQQQTTKGNWVARCDGELPGPAGLANTRILGTCTVTKDNYWTCTAHFNMGGTHFVSALQGQAQNNADCTGFISYQTTIGGQPGPQFNNDYVILEGGDVIWGQARPANPGEVMACTLKRLSKDLR